jgi:hypothetical protein
MTSSAFDLLHLVSQDEIVQHCAGTLGVFRGQTALQPHVTPSHARGVTTSGGASENRAMATC